MSALEDGTTLRVHYFDMKGRAELVRLALVVAGIPFEDVRFGFDKWPDLKGDTSVYPHGVLPVMQVINKGGSSTVIAETPAITAYIAKVYGGGDVGLARNDPLDAARVDEIENATSHMCETIGFTMQEKDEDRRLAMRKELAEDTLPKMLANIDARLQPDGYSNGSTITIGDIAVYTAIYWLQCGAIDHVPTTIADKYKRIKKCCENVDNHPRVQKWNAEHKAAM